MLEHEDIANKYKVWRTLKYLENLKQFQEESIIKIQLTSNELMPSLQLVGAVVHGLLHMIHNHVQTIVP